MTINCLLIGQNNLLIQCGTYLLENNHQIKWVISSVVSIQTWCKKHNIPCIASFRDLPPDSESVVDYIFSIVNGKILTKENLKIARFGAINYHDSLLPKYAGVNATTWAIHNGEKMHGITWHMVNEGIDEGDIVYQTNVPISDNDTALTLNLRCFEEAMKGFVEIIKMIETSSLKKLTQKKEERSYYGKNHVLPDFGFVNWKTATAQKIDFLNRALNFGNYSNNVGSFKLFLNDSYLIISDVEILPESNEFKMGGLVLAIAKDGLVVSTLTQAILIKKFITRNGQVLSINEVVQDYGIHVNYQFPFLDDSLIKQNLNLYSKALSNEEYWLVKLAEIKEHSTFSERVLDKYKTYTELPAVTADNFANINNAEIFLYLFATVLIYLYRLNDYEAFTVFSCHPQLSSNVSLCGGLFSNFLPIGFDLKGELTVDQIVKIVACKLDELSQYGAYLSDIFCRQPALAPLNEGQLITIGISNSAINLSKSSLIHFEIDKTANKLRIYHRLDSDYQGGILKPIISNMSAHINNILKYILLNPNEMIHQFSFLTEEEHKKIFSWGVGEYIALPSYTITELFERQVKRIPDNPAIYHNDDFFTYRQVWVEAEKVAQFIQNLNLSPQTLIGVYSHQNINMLALFLGILKAGCICVFLDTKLPLEEIKSIVNEKKITHLFATNFYHNLLNKNLSDSLNVNFYEIQNFFASQAPLEDVVTFNNILSESNYACMFFSGDDENKNMMVTQKNIINYCLRLNQATQFGEQSVFDLTSSLPLNLFIFRALSSLFAGTAFALCEAEKIN